ncbi:hypothetical protein [Saccharothrix syringae]|uniref:Uncharacterized protein n=1 Tax=Saccharothrix syringae TaxID=103733 RepID=A0A5Q0HAC2_SACSY|nr:hypothetical protein [Saccharothrix syringae]QFZ22885.1 hypothetical protein EKG83_40550 [Saccharothrix syringae]
MVRGRPPVLPLPAGLLVVPAGIVALGLALCGEGPAGALPFPPPPSPGPARPTEQPVRPTVRPVATPRPPTPGPPRRDVLGPFRGNGGEAVRLGVGDLLARRRARPVPEFLVGRGVPAEATTTRVVVDPVWGPPSDGGPQVDVLVG